MVAHRPLPPSTPDPATIAERGVLETTVAWVSEVLEAVDLGPRERLLDLADGTGLVGRAGVGLVQPGGTASVVRAEALEACAARLPYPDASFDVALSLHTLEAFPDRGRVLAELRRVLSPGGRLALAVWGPIGANPVFAALADSLRHRGEAFADAAVHWLLSLSHPDDVRALLAEADFDLLASHRRTVPVLASMDDLFRWLLETFPIGAVVRTMPPDERAEIASDLGRALGRGSGQAVPFTTDLHVARVIDRERRGRAVGGS